MNKKDWYRALNHADDKYIAEAHPKKVIKSQKPLKIVMSVVAACACFLIVFSSMLLFTPYSTTPPSVAAYADSEYYDLIKELNVLTFSPPEHKNNAHWLFDKAKTFAENTLEHVFGFSLLESTDISNDNIPGGMGGGGIYNEITDNQAEGVIEADRIKRSDKHIFYLDGNTLRAYSIDKDNSKEVGSYTIENLSRYKYSVSYWEFYLSNDCKTVTVITEQGAKIRGEYEADVKVISLDVSNPSKITKKDEFILSGSYKTSRQKGDTILLMSRFSVEKPNFADERTFVPYIDEGYGPCPLPAKDIITAEKFDSAKYTVMIKINANTLKVEGQAAYLSYSDIVYVSQDHVFVTNSFDHEIKRDGDIVTEVARTEISCISYKGYGFDCKGKVMVDGYVNDRWALDEYNGILRLVTTTSIEKKEEIKEGNQTYYFSRDGELNANLYCIDLANFEVVASVLQFAPKDELVRSVRFDKDMAYVCTSIELKDPVFFFDLSDLNNITYKDTGTIEGFSTSLINLGEGYLLGIGRAGGWSDFKIEVYKEGEDMVDSVCSYDAGDVYYSTEYKSYYVDRANQLIGIGIVDYYCPDDEKTRYIVLHFDGEKLKKVVNTSLNADPEQMRGVYIDGYMYMFGNDDFKVEKVFD